MAGPTIEVNAPVRKPRLGGIESVATFTQDDRIGTAEAVVHVTEGCSLPDTELLRCFTEDALPDKTFNTVEPIDGIAAPFVVYAGLKSRLQPEQRDMENAASLLERGFGRALEGELFDWLDLATPESVGNLEEAIAHVEQELDSGYPAQGVVVMNRGDAVSAHAAKVLVIGDEGSLITALGTPVLASSKVAPGTVFGTGAIAVTRTGVNTYSAPDIEENAHYAIAESAFAISVDCLVRIKARVQSN